MDLILKEQNLQLSGSVNDADMVRMGNLSGASVIIVAGITGKGVTRRLQIKALDVSTSGLLMTSDTTGKWNL
jgi:hypothetical protein